MEMSLSVLLLRAIPESKALSSRGLCQCQWPMLTPKAMWRSLVWTVPGSRFMSEDCAKLAPLLTCYATLESWLDPHVRENWSLGYGSRKVVTLYPTPCWLQHSGEHPCTSPQQHSRVDPDGMSTGELALSIIACGKRESWPWCQGYGRAGPTPC